MLFLAFKAQIKVLAFKGHFCPLKVGKMFLVEIEQQRWTKVNKGHFWPLKVIQRFSIEKHEKWVKTSFLTFKGQIKVLAFKGHFWPLKVGKMFLVEIEQKRSTKVNKGHFRPLKVMQRFSIEKHEKRVKMSFLTFKGQIKVLAFKGHFWPLKVGKVFLVEIDQKRSTKVNKGQQRSLLTFKGDTKLRIWKISKKVIKGHFWPLKVKKSVFAFKGHV